MKLVITWSVAALLVSATAAHSTGLLPNAANPLSITLPSYGNVNQFVHPDVVWRPGGWNGKNYWMVLEPYPFGDETLENPSIIASNDSISWAEPAGIQNPVANGLPGNCPPGKVCHNNDGDILLVGNTLVMYYNETVNENGNITNIKRLTSTNGTTWSAPQTVLQRTNYPLSPAVVYENNLYTMWFVLSTTGCGGTPEVIKRRRSADGIDWSQYPEETITMTGVSGIVPWHLDVVRDGGKLAMVFAGYPSGNCGTMSLYYAESVDGLNWKASSTPLIAPSVSGWDNPVIYRSSFLANNNNLKVWYSARNASLVWKVGYTQGTAPDLTAPSMSYISGLSGCYDHIAIDWIAPGDDGDGGTATAYDLRWSTVPITEANFSSCSAITTPTPQPAGSSERVVVYVPRCSYQRFYALKTRDEASNWSPVSPWVLIKPACPKPPIMCEDIEGARGVVAEMGMPNVLELSEPQPNPARTSVRLRFGIPAEFSGRTYDLSVFDLSGRRVATLGHGASRTGYQETTWNLRGNDGVRLAQGVYFLNLRLPGRTIQRRIVTLP